jgi:uncharacterized protein YkwD
MVDCDYCNKEIDGLPFKCKFCGSHFCSKHHIPEHHNCAGLEEYNKKSHQRWKNVFISSSKKNKKEPETLSHKKHSKKKHEHRHHKPVKRTIKHSFIRFFSNLGRWLNDKDYHRYRFYSRRKYLFKIFLGFIIALVAYNVFYSNLSQLNEIVLIFIKLGSLLLLASVVFLIYYGWKILKEIPNILKRQRKWIKYLVIIIILLLLWNIYTNRETVIDPAINLYNETNFTIFNPFSISTTSLKSSSESSGGDSSNNGGFFDDVEEIFKSEPEREEECKQTFDKLNDIRGDYGKNRISWNQKANEFAVARSKDMYERDYFDHVTPEGECANTMKSSYGFRSNEYLAENAGGMSYYSKGSVAGDCDEALAGWLDSRGHRYNVLYDDHNSGAIGCYYEICIFFGVHNDPYGLGAGPCATGDEGAAYWDGLPTQPGEV